MPERTVLKGLLRCTQAILKSRKRDAKTLKRAAHHRGETAKQRGLSEEQVYVFRAQDRSHHSYESVTGEGPVSWFWLNAKVSPLIARDSILVADGLPSCQAMAKRGALNLVVGRNQPGRRVQSSYHTKHVYALHSRLKGWINGHSRGVPTRYLDHYLRRRHEIENQHIQAAEDLFRAALRQAPQLA